MSEVEVIIEFDGFPHPYAPGELLRGQFTVSSPDWQAAEISVLWFTEGKGEEDMGIHYFERIDRDDEDLARDDEPQGFMALLPASPLSYHGLILSIRWCVRVRVFLERERDREVVGERHFALGNVPSPRLMTP
jgi:hypothetical protein